MEEYLEGEVIEVGGVEKSEVYFCGFEGVVCRWFLLCFYCCFFEGVDCECLFWLFFWEEEG